MFKVYFAILKITNQTIFKIHKINYMVPLVYKPKCIREFQCQNSKYIQGYDINFTEISKLYRYVVK